MSSALSTYEIRELVFTWFRKLTDHAPIEELLALLKIDALQMKFPETTIDSRDGFIQWYEGVTRKFFDQVHETKSLDIELHHDSATVRLVVNWQARTWDPPEGYSRFTSMYAYQTWQISKEPNSGRAVIRVYSVDRLEEALPRRA